MNTVKVPKLARSSSNLSKAFIFRFVFDGGSKLRRCKLDPYKNDGGKEECEAKHHFCAY